MSAAFLVWFEAFKKRDARLSKQYTSNKPKGIV